MIYAGPLAPLDILILIFMLSVITIGLKDNDKGHIGDIIVQGTSL